MVVNGISFMCEHEKSSVWLKLLKTASLMNIALATIVIIVQYAMKMQWSHLLVHQQPSLEFVKVYENHGQFKSVQSLKSTRLCQVCTFHIASHHLFIKQWAYSMTISSATLIAYAISRGNNWQIGNLIIYPYVDWTLDVHKTPAKKKKIEPLQP